MPMNRRGQNLLEYVVLFCVILSALLIMQVYVKRAYQSRIKDESDNLGGQYSPKHTTSLSKSSMNATTISYTGGETDQGFKIADGVTATVTNTSTSSAKTEKVDSFASEK